MWRRERERERQDGQCLLSQPLQTKVDKDFIASSIKSGYSEQLQFPFFMWWKEKSHKETFALS
jgi:hypothetical protein